MKTGNCKATGELEKAMLKHIKPSNEGTTQPTDVTKITTDNTKVIELLFNRVSELEAMLLRYFNNPNPTEEEANELYFKNIEVLNRKWKQLKKV